MTNLLQATSTWRCTSTRATSVSGVVADALGVELVLHLSEAQPQTQMTPSTAPESAQPVCAMLLSASLQHVIISLCFCKLQLQEHCDICIISVQA